MIDLPLTLALSPRGRGDKNKRYFEYILSPKGRGDKNKRFYEYILSRRERGQE
ncbi:Uncharacterised protein [Cedecea davisae]|uniref:Uncharacterized protein n=1 Tax=Cedecea davisae DSM 4568 TaxID=566551 RepID=S3IN41_9ENTR|nr:hypothetical protein HMPREF0201_03444 [Cedecea davisae DSM 4568]SUX38213.1 Uncharacterised protein [Cedecea davisae]